MTIEKIAFPVVIGAAVLGIWAALRKPGNPAYTMIAGPSNQGAGLPQIPALAPYLVSAPPLVTLAPAAGGIGTNSDYTRRARQVPADPNITPAIATGPQVYNGLPPNLYTNLSPWNFQGTASPAPGPPAPASGCGGSCGGCGSKSASDCSQRTDVSNNRFTDGRGACLTITPQVAGVARAASDAAAFVGRYAISSAYTWNAPPFESLPRPA